MSLLARRQLPLTAKDAAIACSSMQYLSSFARKREPQELRVVNAGHATPIELPAAAVSLLMEILEAMASGRGITVVPENAELTTVEAADILNVSRPFLIKLLEQGKIPYRKVGNHRRMRMEDIMAYKASIDREREAVLDQLVADPQERDMGYSKR